jgi:ribosomal protein L37AE/L43A
MKTRDCPRCRRHSLFQTGAFWACGMCRYAITQTALLADEAGEQSRSAGSHAGNETVP